MKPWKPWLVAWALALPLAVAAGDGDPKQGAAAPEPSTTDPKLKEADKKRLAEEKRLETELAQNAKRLEAEPDSERLQARRADLLGRLGRREEAIRVLDRAIERSKDPILRPRLFDRRGDEYFRLGKFKESLADYDRALSKDPVVARWHWRRGIVCYYAGQYLLGEQQFTAYQKADASDVENAVWRYLCMARRLGVKKARAEIFEIRGDGRVPMGEVWELYAGKIQPEAVLAAAKAGSPPSEILSRQLFYAHLYLGLYYECEGKPKLAASHMNEAAKRAIDHYMGDVAKVHARLLKERAKSSGAERSEAEAAK